MTPRAGVGHDQVVVAVARPIVVAIVGGVVVAVVDVVLVGGGLRVAVALPTAVLVLEVARPGAEVFVVGGGVRRRRRRRRCGVGRSVVRLEEVRRTGLGQLATEPAKQRTFFLGT